MIEARCAWTLEGPDDSITFDPFDDSTPWMLVSKPRTAVDDRRATYDYPLDDGAYIGDAYAGHRVWTLEAKLRATSHEERNVQSQRLTALLNSLRRADGYLKWQPEGFPAVQCAVRRNGAVDNSGGFGTVLPATFSLISGDPRVYSQEAKSVEVMPGALNTVSGEPYPTGAGDTALLTGDALKDFETGLTTTSPNLLTTNQSSFETSTDGWALRPGTYGSFARSTTYAHIGTASLKLNANGTTLGAATPSAIADAIPVTAGVAYYFDAKSVKELGQHAIVDQVLVEWLDAGGTEISQQYLPSGQSFSSGPYASVWARRYGSVTAPTGAHYCVLTMKPSLEVYIDNIGFEPLHLPFGSSWVGRALSRSNVTSSGGSYSLLMQARAQSPAVTVTPGDNVRVEFKCRSNRDGISVYDPKCNRTVTPVFLLSSGSRVSGPSEAIVAWSDWLDVSFVAVAPTDAVQMALLIDEAYSQPSADMYLDQLTITKLGSTVSTATNEGDADTLPIIDMYAPCDAPMILNNTTREFALVDAIPAAGNLIRLDRANRTVDEIDAGVSVENLYGAKPATHRIPTIARGVNEFYVTDADNTTYAAGFRAVVQWRDAWMP